MAITNKAKDNTMIEQLVEDVVNTSAEYIKECQVPIENVTITEWDIDRVSIDIDGRDFSIRMWNIYEIGSSTNIDWQLFLTAGDHGIDLNSGGSTFNNG